MDLILGKETVHDTYIEELNGTLPLRPLTDGEWSQVQNLQRKGMKLKTAPMEPGKARTQKPEVGFEFDLQEFSQAEYAADLLIVKFGVVIPGGLTDTDIKNMKAGAPAAIARKILEITGVKKENIEQIKSFRKQ